MADEPYIARRPKRADGRRNYDAILAAARKAFEADGSEASLEDIAGQAQVAIGTLYRHFPTRASLVEAARQRPSWLAESQINLTRGAETRTLLVRVVAEFMAARLIGFVVTFDDPAGFAPQAHVNTAEQVPWLKIHDELPRYAAFGDSA